MVIEKAGRCRIERKTVHAWLLVPTRQDLASGNEPRAVGEGEIHPRPFKENGDAVAEADEEVDVDRQPGKPRHEAAPVRFERPLDFGDSGKAADRGHVTLVEITEGL